MDSGLDIIKEKNVILEYENKCIKVNAIKICDDALRVKVNQNQIYNLSKVKHCKLTIDDICFDADLYNIGINFIDLKINEKNIEESKAFCKMFIENLKKYKKNL